MSESPLPPPDPDVDIDLDRPSASAFRLAPDDAAPAGGHWLGPLIGPEALGLVGLVLAMVGLFGERFVQLAAIASNGGLTDGLDRTGTPPIAELGTTLGLVSAALGVTSLRRRPRHRTVSAWTRGIAAAASMLGLLVAVGYWLLVQ